ncbi:MAG: alpha/beta hydrolase [Sphingomonadaceae bacterium]
MALVGGILKWLLLSLLFLLVAVFIVRAWQAMRGPPLEPWHTHVPAEPSAAEIDRLDWTQWVDAERRLFEATARVMAERLPADARIPQNRYWPEAPMHPARLPTDWNRSFTLEPDGEATGAVVLLHGLTDSPYSLRHVGRLYEARGWHVVAVRLPGHGTVPAGLTAAGTEQWLAATRLAVREARRRAGPDRPLHIAGYSNGAALALIHALDALETPAIGRPDRILLVSPMIGLTPFARFTGLAGWPAFLPAFARAAWLDTIPEYNPFKYNSFPVKAGAEAHRLTVLLSQRMDRAASANRLSALPPILAFQSVVDSTVSTPAVISGLFDRLPEGGHELVLFDINRAAYVGPLLRRSSGAAIDRLIPTSARRYRTTLVANRAANDPAVEVRSWPPGASAPEIEPLGIDYPRNIFSLSHIALPFPPSDGLYGTDPDPADNQGVALGALATRGENGQLAVSPASLMRLSSNPFFPWMLGRIDRTLADPTR